MMRPANPITSKARFEGSGMSIAPTATRATSEALSPVAMAGTAANAQTTPAITLFMQPPLRFTRRIHATTHAHIV